MGSELRRELRDLLGPDIKGLKRAIALEIADDARYDDDMNYSPKEGRRSKVTLADLALWTAAKDERTVREELRRLAMAGWEFRVPIGVGKDGRKLFAWQGRAMEFRVPEGPTVVASDDEAQSKEEPTTVAQGPTVVAQEPTTVASEATTVGPPSLSPSSRSSLSPDACAPDPQEPPASPVDEREIEAAPETTNDGTDVAKVVEAWTATRGKGRNPAAESKVRESALLLLSVGWTIPDLIGLAEDMAKRQPAYMDLGKHEPHWVRPKRLASGPRPRAVVDHTEGRDLECDECGRPVRPDAPFGLCPACHDELEQATPSQSAS